MITNDDGCVTVAVPNGETWKSGEVRQAADGRLGVVANGPALTGDSAGSVKATLNCASDVEVEITTSVIAAAGATLGVDIDEQKLVAADGGDKNVRLVVYAAAANGKARVVLN